MPPLTAPENDEALADVTMLPEASRSVTVTVTCCPGVSVEAESANVLVLAETAPAVTTTDRRDVPVAEMVPSVAAMTAVSTAYSVIGTFAAAPFTNVTLVAVPNAVASTSGALEPPATDAPLNVRDLAPV